MEQFLKQLINELPGLEHETVSSIQLSGVGGGSINHTYRVSVNQKPACFLKTNKAASLPGLFEKERQGLEFLASQQLIIVPTVLYSGTFQDDQLLLLEWVDQGLKTDSFWKKFGEQLANLHQCSSSRFGFEHNNYMGALTQVNDWTDSWTDFFIKYRLVPQIDMALANHLLSKKEAGLFEQLYRKLDSIFNPEKPALLHGDLWSGNFLCNQDSEPVLIDPAVYYGHRSVDLAMTTLFGGFSSGFYSSYHYHYPFPSNYQEQWDICNLYPLLIHLNLFGQSYLPDIKATLQKYG